MISEDAGVNNLNMQSLPGPNASDLVDTLAEVRIRVFSEWPYLYAGTLSYEREYLATYFDCDDALVLIARDGDQVIGVSTALPLAAAESDMRAPFEAASIDVGQWLYFGESVVLPEYRGHGLGVGFFAERESHAMALGLEHCTFCSVERPDDHPARPQHYFGNERFWENRGYQPMDLRCQYEWPDIGATQPTAKPMRFWQRRLPATIA